MRSGQRDVFCACVRALPPGCESLPDSIALLLAMLWHSIMFFRASHRASPRRLPRQTPLSPKRIFKEQKAHKTGPTTGGHEIECRSPTSRFGECASEYGGERRAQDGCCVVHAYFCTPFVRLVHVCQRAGCDGQHGGGTGRLDDSHGDQESDTVGGGTDADGDGEDAHGGQETGFATDEFGKGRPEEGNGALCEDVKRYGECDGALCSM